MSAREFEAFLTRIYVDSAARARFQSNPRKEASRAGLSEDECAALERMDWAGLELATRSYANKRALKAKSAKAHSAHSNLRNLLSVLSRRIRSLL